MKAGLPLLAAVLLATTACDVPRWPVDAPLTSDFGLRFRGIRPDLHRGVDLRAPMGTEVRSMAEATVHLSEIRVAQGQRVGRGELVGLSGQSGDATAPHLHFEVWRGGIEVDPVPLLGGKPRT